MKAAGCVSGSLLGEKLSEESFSPDPFSKTFIPFFLIGAIASMRTNKVKFSEGSLRGTLLQKGSPQ